MWLLLCSDGLLWHIVANSMRGGSCHLCGDPAHHTWSMMVLMLLLLLLWVVLRLLWGMRYTMSQSALLVMTMLRLMMAAMCVAMVRSTICMLVLSMMLLWMVLRLALMVLLPHA